MKKQTKIKIYENGIKIDSVPINDLNDIKKALCRWRKKGLI